VSRTELREALEAVRQEWRQMVGEIQRLRASESVLPLLALLGGVQVQDRTGELPAWKRDGRVPESAPALLQVDGKVFYFDGQRWVDTACPKEREQQRTLNLAVGSPAYWQALAAQPRLARYFALGAGTILSFPEMDIELTAEPRGQKLTEAETQRLRELKVE
jgi:hypothetical protein